MKYSIKNKNKNKYSILSFWIIKFWLKLTYIIENNKIISPEVDIGIGIGLKNKNFVDSFFQSPNNNF